MSASNPTAVYGIPTYATANGRPPDNYPMVNSPISLERPASPSPLENQPIVKKNKNEGGIVANLDDSAMDAEVGDGPQRIVPDGNHVGEKPDSGVGKSVTYASVTAKLTSDGSKPKSTTASIDEEVIILEDDVILNRKEKIPSIQFSNRVHDQDNVGEEVSEDRLFGPWMVVENRRRRTNAVSRSNGGSMSGGNATGGSRFGVLHVDENAKDTEGANVGQGRKVQLQSITPTVQPNRGERVNRMDVSIGPTKNYAYLKSNPDKKNKKPIGDSRSVTIISSLGGKEASAMVHKHSIASGLHSARNLKGRKSAEAQVLDTRVVSEFITDLIDRLDSFQDPSSSLMEKDGDDNELGGSEEGLFDSDSRGNDDHDEDVILVEQ
ncbi:hypothetical protein V6N11_029791 [Hibiscus sabdariffa]|uniref:Uncharacterized protein n=1 Tax=Hibiscus sabdariffa TaxID=183260 RepID=A0ABR2PIY6_9ROSI